jgi:hypothetical protein
MEQMIVCGVVMLALCWWASASRWSMVNAPVRVAQGLSLRRLRNQR